MASKTKIEKKLRKKGNPELAKLIILLKKQDKKIWLSLANMLASPKRKAAAVNISKINKLTKTNDTIVVPGKILSDGELDHSLTIASFKMSEISKEKLKKAKILTIENLLKQNPEGKNIKVII